MYRRRIRTHVASWGLGANRCAPPPKSVYPFCTKRPIAPLPTCSSKKCTQKLFLPRTKISYEDNYKDNKQTKKKNNNILACNDNHIIHHLHNNMFFFSLQKTTWWYLVIGDGWMGLGWAKVGGVERLNVVLSSSPPQHVFLRFTAGGLHYSYDYMKSLLAAGLDSVFCYPFDIWCEGWGLDWSLVCSVVELYTFRWLGCFSLRRDIPSQL